MNILKGKLNQNSHEKMMKTNNKNASYISNVSSVKHKVILTDTTIKCSLHDLELPLSACQFMALPSKQIVEILGNMPVVLNSRVIAERPIRLSHVNLVFF